VKTFLWSLLLIVPGLIAAMRYSLAPYYLAEDPSISVTEALRRSKETMADKKMSLFMLEISFLIWLLGAMLMETLLVGISPILALVASQFIQLMMATYLNAAVAGFYRAAAVPEGFARAQADAAQWLRSVGGSGFAGAGRHFGSDDNTTEDAAEPEDAAENADADDPQGDGAHDPIIGGHGDGPNGGEGTAGDESGGEGTDGPRHG
jgi:hypothetical protein